VDLARNLNGATVGQVSLNGDGERKYDDLEKQLAAAPVITVTDTSASSARSYWDYSATAKRGFFDVKGATIPVAVSAFPDEIYTRPAQLGRESVSQAHLLQQASQRRALRGVGAAAILFRGRSCGFAIPTQIDLKWKPRSPRQRRPRTSRPTIKPSSLTLDKTKTSEQIDQHRRRLFGAAAMAFAAVQLGMIGSANAQAVKASAKELPVVKPGTHTSFDPLKQIDAPPCPA